jgi:hypothetical protein
MRNKRQGYAMTDAHGIARNTAKRLAPQFGEALPLNVEKVIHGAGAAPGQFDLGALAGLAAIAAFIVQCSQFAFEWRKERRGRKEEAKAANDEAGALKAEIEALKRELRLIAARLEGVDAKARDQVIEAVVKETQDGGGA